MRKLKTLLALDALFSGSNATYMDGPMFTDMESAILSKENRRVIIPNTGTSRLASQRKRRKLYSQVPQLRRK